MCAFRLRCCRAPRLLPHPGINRRGVAWEVGAQRRHALQVALVSRCFLLPSLSPAPGSPAFDCWTMPKRVPLFPRSAHDPAKLLRVTHAASEGEEGEMHDPLLDDCFSFSRGAPFRDAVIASAAEYADCRQLFETNNLQPSRQKITIVNEVLA